MESHNTSVQWEEFLFHFTMGKLRHTYLKWLTESHRVNLWQSQKQNPRFSPSAVFCARDYAPSLSLVHRAHYLLYSLKKAQYLKLQCCYILFSQWLHFNHSCVHIPLSIKWQAEKNNVLLYIFIQKDNCYGKLLKLHLSKAKTIHAHIQKEQAETIL